MRESGVDMLRVRLRCLLLKCLKFKAIIILTLIYDCVLYELYLYSIVGIAIATDFRPIGIILVGARSNLNGEKY